MEAPSEIELAAAVNSLTGLPVYISVFNPHFPGAYPRTRTETVLILNQPSLPIGIDRHMVLPAGFEPATLGP